MATFEELLQQFKQKKLDGAIPMERPADDLGVLPAISQPTDEEVATQKSNEQMLGLPNIEIPYRPEGNIAGINLPQSAPAIPAAESDQEASPEHDVVKAMRSIGSKASVAPQQNKMPPIASAAPVVPAMTDDMRQFQDAQALADKRRMIAGMLKAGSEIGEGIGGLGAGQKLNMPESRTAKYLEESANNPITDLAAKRKAEKEGLDLMDDRAKNDPNSEVSKLYRDSFKKLGVTVGESATAAALEKAQPAIGAMLNKQMHDEMMKQRYAEMAQNKQIAAGDRASAKATAEQTKAFEKTQALMEQMRGNPAVQQAERDLYAAEKFNDLIDLHGDPNNLNPQMVQLAATEVAKIASGGVPTSHELQGLKSGSISSKLAEASQAFSNSPSKANQGAFLKEYKDYVKSLEKSAKHTVVDRYGRILESSARRLNPEDKALLESKYIKRFENDDKMQMAAGEPSKGTVSKATVQDYAKKHNMDAQSAADLLTKSGYVIK